MTASNLSIVMAPNLLWPSSNAEDGGNRPSTPPRLDFAESNLINDIIESIIVNVQFYFGEENVDFFQDPPTLIGSKKIAASIKNSNLLNSTTVGSKPLCVDTPTRSNTSGSSGSNAIPPIATYKTAEDSATLSLSSNSLGQENTVKPTPSVPAQRTPVPKPRGSKVGYGKPNPPPRPTERPKNITDDGGIQVVESITKL